MCNEVWLATDLLDELLHEAKVVPTKRLNQLRDVKEHGVGRVGAQTPKMQFNYLWNVYFTQKYILVRKSKTVVWIVIFNNLV
jgi:hypothetical protein